MSDQGAAAQASPAVQTSPARPPRGPWLVGGLPGPVFAKDVWILGKRPSTAWIRLVYSLLLLAIVALVFSVSSDFAHSIGSGIAARLQRSQEVAPAVTLAIIWSQFVMLLIIGAGLGAPAISDEVRAGSLATLLTTPLRPVQIIAGKLLSRLVELAILTLIPLPLMLALRSFGGVPAETVLIMTGLCLVLATLAVQVGIFYSVCFKRPAAPLVLTVITLAVLTAGLPGVLAALGEVPHLASFKSILQQSATVMSPPFLLMMNSAVLMNDSAMPLFTSVAAASLAAMGVTLLWWLVFFGLSCVMLRRVMRAEDRAKPSVAVAAPAVATAVVAAAAPTATTTSPSPTQHAASTRKRRTSPAQAGVSRVVSDNPVVWRELQQPILGRTWLMWLMGVVVGLAVLFLYYISGLDEVVQIGIAVTGIVIWLLFAAVATTGSIAQEREGRTFDVLLTTPLSARDIVWGKFVGGLRRLWIGPAFILLHVLVAGCLSGLVAAVLEPLDHVTGINRMRGTWQPDFIHPLALVVLPFVLAGPIVFLAASGVWLSSIIKRNTAAAIFNLAIALGLWLIIPIFLAVLFSGFMSGDGEELVTLYLIPNPVLLAASTLDGCDVSFDWFGSSFELIGPDSLKVGFVGFAFIALAVCGTYCLLALFCLRSAARQISKGTGRSR
jgi:ABC-type transport system involved in multi-copper enzyme maturation permease subunit